MCRLPACDRHPAAPQLDLLRGLLAGRVEDLRLRRKPRRDIQHERGLSHARISAKENQRACDDAAAQHAIELRDARRRAGRLRAGDFLKRDRRRIPGPRHDRQRRSTAASFFNERVPLLARRTSANPFRGNIAALLAGVLGSGFQVRQPLIQGLGLDGIRLA